MEYRPALNARLIESGMIFLQKGRLFRALSRARPMPLSRWWEVSVTHLPSGERSTIPVNPAMDVEIIHPIERQVEYVYAAEGSYILYDAASNEEFAVPLELGEAELAGAEPGDAFIAGFWGRMPVTIRRVIAGV